MTDEIKPAIDSAFDPVGDTGKILAQMTPAERLIWRELKAIRQAITNRDKLALHTFKKIFSNILGILKDPEL